MTPHTERIKRILLNKLIFLWNFGAPQVCHLNINKTGLLVQEMYP